MPIAMLWSFQCALAFGIVCLSAGVLSAAPPRLDDAPGFEGMRERWAGLMDQFDVPGMAVAIVKDGEILAIETFGMRAPAAPGQPAAAPTPETMFYIASITKTYLATAISALADDGKLTLDDPVNKHLPRFAVAAESTVNADEITIRDLLCHKVGIAPGEPIVTLDAFTGEITEDRYYHWLATIRPRGSIAYSNVHYTLLGRIVESVSGVPWRDYLEQRIFKPAGLTRTTGYASRMYGDADCAQPMERIDDEWRVCKLRKTDRTMHAAGGLGASANDAARWLLLHVNDGEIDGKRVISAERAREMRRLQGPFAEKQGSIRIMEGFGLGWQVGSFHGAALCSHGGGYAGTQTYYAILPEKKCGLALLMNASGPAMGLQDVIAVDILDRLIEGDERVDVLNAYVHRVAEHKKQIAARLIERKETLSKPFELTQAIDAYAGRYSNELLGTITVAVDGTRLSVHMGECLLDVMPASSDAFRVMGPAAEGVLFKFDVNTDGRVAAVGFDLPQLGRMLFVR